MLVILIICGLLYDYHHIAFYRPVGIHQWRNCVSAAFPVNYYYGGNFLTPQTNALLADNNTSDVTVVEFPVLYYIVSLFYRIFGTHEFLFRIFQVAIGFTGLVFLFKAGHYFTGDWFYAGVVPLIIFSSPVYVFYLNNFIPDAAALSLTFIGFYYFMKYHSVRRIAPWLVSMLFFLLAGLIKTSSLLPYFGLAGVALLELFTGRGRTERESYFRFRLAHIATFMLVIVLVSGWYLYARLYSDAHGGSVSAIEIRPIWELSGETIRATLESMKHWFRNGTYHATYFLYFSLAVFIFTLIFRKKANRFLYRFNILVFLGAVSFTLFFFRDMRNHDYYQTNNLFILVTVYLTGFTILRGMAPGVYRSIWTKAAVSVVLIFLVINCMNRMHVRYSDRDMHYVSSSKTVEMFDIEGTLDALGIDRSAKVHCTPDRSINISLYLCNRKGLTDYSGYSKLSLEERIAAMKEIGIEYVILGSREPYREVENLDEVFGEKIGQAGGTEIFKLTGP